MRIQYSDFREDVGGGHVASRIELTCVLDETVASGCFPSRYVTDIHVTVLHQLGLDPRQLAVPGRKRLEIDFGSPITEIIA